MGGKLPNPTLGPSTSSRTPLRSIPSSATTPDPSNHFPAPKELCTGAQGPCENTGEVSSGLSKRSGASRLNCNPAGPAYSASGGSAACIGSMPAAASSLPQSGPPEFPPAGTWRRPSEPRPSRLSARRSDGVRGQVRQAQRQPPGSAVAAAAAPGVLQMLSPAVTAAAAAPRNYSPDLLGPASASDGSGRGAASPAAHCCPVCGCDLVQISDTATGREAHVNVCLDGGGGGGDVGCSIPGASRGSGMTPRQPLGASPSAPREHLSAAGVKGLASRPRWAVRTGPVDLAGPALAGAQPGSGRSFRARGGVSDGAGAGQEAASGSAPMEIELLDSDDDCNDAMEVRRPVAENAAVAATEGVKIADADSPSDAVMVPPAAKGPWEPGAVAPEGGGSGAATLGDAEAGPAEVGTAQHSGDAGELKPAACDGGDEAARRPDGPNFEWTAAGSGVDTEPYDDDDGRPEELYGSFEVHGSQPGACEHGAGECAAGDEQLWDLWDLCRPTGPTGRWDLWVGPEEEVEEDGGDEEEEDPVAAWLRRHRLQRWLPRFRDGEVDEAVVPELNDTDLQGLGVDSPRARAAILAAVKDFAAAPPPPLPQRKPAVATGAAAVEHSGPPASKGPVSASGVPKQPTFPNQGHRDPIQQQQQLLSSCQQRQPGQQQGRGSAAAPLPCVALGVRPHGGAPPAAAGPVLGAVGAAQAPFASMFQAKPSGPVRITSFFRGPAAAADVAAAAGMERASEASVGSGPGAGAMAARSSWGAAAQSRQQHHPAIVPEGQAAAMAPRQQQPLPAQQWARRPPPPPQQQQGSATGGSGGGPAGRLPRWVPECHTIPGTRMLVDFFGPPSKGITAAVSPFRILTHFHADHYKGLTRSFAGGTVLASPVTARLVSERLKLPAARLQVLPMDTPVEVDGVSLTLVDANHCPGAAMVVAQPPGGWPPVLHTGDCRLADHMRGHPALQALVGRRCTLVLDTTYCDPQYEFPPQKAVLDAVMEAVKAESFNKRALFVFGTYTIGKERLFLEVAAALGQKVYCSKEKAATLAACGLAPRYASLITTNHLEAAIHAVPLFKVTLEGLAAILQQYRGRYSAVIGFSPTGWNHTGGPRGGANGGGSGRGRGRGGRGGGGGVLSRQQQSAVIGRRMARGTAVVYQVPYSEHSSFGELRSFVSWLQPGRIVPSVNTDGPAGPRTRRMLQLLQGPASEGAAAAGDGGSGGVTAAAQAVARRDIRSFLRGGGGTTPAGAAATAAGAADAA